MGRAAFQGPEISVDFQDRSKGRTTVQEDRNDLQLVNLCVPSRSAIVKEKEKEKKVDDDDDNDDDDEDEEKEERKEMRENIEIGERGYMYTEHATAASRRCACVAQWQRVYRHSCIVAMTAARPSRVFPSPPFSTF
ncbi:hypothetical protein HZH68_015178 [Vespula germanica]|uniref:Uncharacterized protein n=1 Tax=Vespula germanica TaxID=30212 RepID=A0A834MTP8_VESGE|nr:hypothetical protein HZH68_015178 [Vespula germanica]